ncbi:MAG: aspartate aminotransferase family protein [Deltaproteobacteria bacterium]|nr:aspartate aminotransferase family protein [Deltaproteobacteria bacterium]
MTEDYLEQYERQTPGSKRIHERAREYTPGGLSHDARYHSPYPIYMSSAKGCRVWDVDSNEYFDLWMAHYDAILGHSPPEVLEELKRAMMDGLHVGLAMEHEVRLAKRVVDMVPGVDQVRFCSSGTEATMYAVRLARGFTGRNVIIKMVGGWHGSNTDLMVDVRPPEYIGPECRGLPPDLGRYTRSVEFNDIKSMERLMDEVGDDLAAVIMEPALGPAGFLKAEPEYVKFLKEQTKYKGALLIFDEVITGFRLAPGGAQEVYGIKPDLTTMGKILGGGMPIGAVGGRKEIMERSSVTRSGGKMNRVAIGGGTYSCNPLSMIAGRVTLDILRDQKHRIYPALENANRLYCEGVEEAFANVGIPVFANQFGSLNEVHFLREHGLPVRNMAEVLRHTNREMQAEYLVRLRNHGLFLFHGGAFSMAHQPGDIQEMLAINRRVADEMARKWVDSDTF